MLKLSDNPPLTPPEFASVTQMPGRWWVAHTKARFEKAFAFDMLERGIAYFLPLTLRVRISGGRKRHVMHPVFPSYVFVNGDDEARFNALSTGRLCQMIEVKDQLTFTRELASIEKALKGAARLDPYPHAVTGMRCRVIAGPFMGIEGTVVNRSGLARIVLEVGILGQGASMEIDADLLESCEQLPRTGQMLARA